PLRPTCALAVGCSCMHVVILTIYCQYDRIGNQPRPDDAGIFSALQSRERTNGREETPMRGWHHLVLLVAMLAAPAVAQTGGQPPSRGAPRAAARGPTRGVRPPSPRREDLDEVGQRMYDRGTTPGATIAGLQGPAGIQLYATRAAGYLQPLNRYLRFESGLSPRIREIAILITAREMDSQFECVAPH